MLACLSIGNTHCSLRIFQIPSGNCIKQNTWKTSLLMKNNNFLTSFLKLSNLQIHKILMCSVVPELDNILANILQQNNQQLQIIKVTASDLKYINIKLKYDGILGADRVANIIGAYNLYSHYHYMIIIDIGTATTCCIIDNIKSEYLGGWICPGLHLQCKSLNEHTAQIKDINILNNKESINLSSISLSRGTKSQVKNGIYAMHYYFIQSIKNQFSTYLSNFNSQKHDFISFCHYHNYIKNNQSPTEKINNLNKNNKQTAFSHKHNQYNYTMPIYDHNQMLLPLLYKKQSPSNLEIKKNIIYNDLNYIIVGTGGHSKEFAMLFNSWHPDLLFQGLLSLEKLKMSKL